MKDHTSHNTQPTAVGDHCREHGHVINKNNVEVLAREEGWFKRKIREAIEIKTLQPTINRDQGFDLPAICQCHTWSQSSDERPPSPGDRGSCQ